MTNRLSRWLLIAIVMIAASFWWLLIDTDRSPAPAKPIHIAELRALAVSLPGQRPTGASYTELAMRKTTGDFYAAGIGLKRRPLAIIAWTLPVSHKAPIIIDPAATGTGQAPSLILTTQGPLDQPPRAARRPVPRLTRQSAQPVSVTMAQAVAPGVVVIPASSHAPDARLIFVQLADGREFLFTGSIAPFTENWARLRARSRLAAVWGPAQNRAETYAWLRTIRQLHREAPNMKIVPGHDDAWVTAERSSGAITELRPGISPISAKAR